MSEAPSISNVIAEMVEVGKKEGATITAKSDEVVTGLTKLGLSEIGVRRAIERATASGVIRKVDDKLIYFMVA